MNCKGEGKGHENSEADRSVVLTVVCGSRHYRRHRGSQINKQTDRDKENDREITIIV